MMKWITREEASQTFFMLNVLAYKDGHAPTILSQNPRNFMEWGRHMPMENKHDFVAAKTQPDFILNYHPLPETQSPTPIEGEET